jgi:hypothetical protein
VGLERWCFVLGLECGVGEGIARQDGVGHSGGGRGDARSTLVVSKGSEVNRLIVRHGGRKREAWETPTCENFHKSGAAAGNSLWLCVEEPGNRSFGIKHIPKLCFVLLI